MHIALNCKLFSMVHNDSFNAVHFKYWIGRWSPLQMIQMLPSNRNSNKRNFNRSFQLIYLSILVFFFYIFHYFIVFVGMRKYIGKCIQI